MFDPETRQIIFSRNIKWADWTRITPSDSLRHLFNQQNETGIDETTNEEQPMDNNNSHSPNVHDLRPPEVGRKEDHAPKTERMQPTEYEIETDTEIEKPPSTEQTKEHRTIITRSKTKQIEIDDEIENEPVAEQSIEVNLSENKSKQDGFLSNWIFNSSIMTDPGEPSTIEEAFKGNEKEQWKAAIANEIMNFLRRNAWKKVDREYVIKTLKRKPLKTTTVLKKKIKHDGSIQYKARICTKGFMMIPGIDFEESYSPVATDSSNKIVIGVSLYFRNQARINGDYRQQWILEAYDVEAAFLSGEVRKKIYLEIPPAMKMLNFVTEKEARENLIELMCNMYGNIDAARVYYERMSNVMKKLGMKQSLTDPCVFFKHGDNGELILILVVHVDDTLITGPEDEVHKFMDEFEKHLKIERLGTLKKHLGIWYNWKSDAITGDEYLEANMSKLIDETCNIYTETTGITPKLFPTPATPGTVLTTNDGKVPMETSKYRSIVGKLLYYATKLGPDISNAVRDLSRHLSNPGPQHWEALERVVGYLSNKDNQHIIFKAPRTLQSISYVDSNYAQDAEDRRSISGRVNTIGGTLTSWNSKKQTTVALSSTEAEYIAFSECCQEAIFQTNLLEELLGEQKPAIIYEDNTGAIFLVNNQTVGARTKHIDIRYHWIRDLIRDKRIEVRFIRSEDNVADCLTKNLPVGEFEKHAKSLRLNELSAWREDVKSAETGRSTDAPSATVGRSTDITMKTKFPDYSQNSIQAPQPNGNFTKRTIKNFTSAT
jgi:hypothetical protein